MIRFKTAIMPDKSKLISKVLRAQKVVDSEVLRRCDPLVPFKTGSLKRSGITGTKIGSGQVRYTAPYAKRQYYFGKPAKNNLGRGRLWFGRMKFKFRHEIRAKAQKSLEE